MTEWAAPPDADPDTGAGQEPMRAEVRLRMKPNRAARGYVDGAWWPRSHDPAAEFPGLILAMSPWVGPVRRMSYHLGDWDPTARELVVEGWSVRLAGFPTMEANTVIVTGSNQCRRILLVVPPGTPAAAARAVLTMAAGVDIVASVEEILAGNGVRPGGRQAGRSG